MPKTFSFGFLMGCSSVLLVAGTVGAGYGMRGLFLTEPRPPVNSPPPVANQGATQGKEPEKAPAHLPEKGTDPAPANADPPKLSSALRLTLAGTEVGEPQGAESPVQVRIQAADFATVKRDGRDAPDLVFDVETTSGGTPLPDLSARGFAATQDPAAIRDGVVPVLVKLAMKPGSYLVRVTGTDRHGGSMATLDVPVEIAAAAAPAGADPTALDRFKLAQELAAKGDKEGAVAEYTAALELQPGWPAALLNRGNLLDDLQRYDEAIADYQKVLEAEPANAGAMNNLAFVWRNKGDLEKALRFASWALETDAKLARAWYLRGMLHDEAGHYPEALADLKRFLELEPDSPSAVQVKAKVKELQDRKK